MSDPRDLDAKEQRRFLDRFVVDNAELEDLSARLSIFNILKVLGVERAEIRHSNLLAWLLDPQAPHGLGDAFLRRFLSSVLLSNADCGGPIALSAAAFELDTITDPIVLRESRHIDVLIVDRERRWVLLIENKVGAKESAGQLARYIAAVAEEFPGVPLIPVFLTLQRDDPSEAGKEQGWITFSHDQVRVLLERLVAQRRQHIPSDAQVLLEHYLATLRRLTMSDPEIVALCKTIFQKHREAITLINEYGTVSRIAESVGAFIEGLSEKLLVLQKAPYSTWVIPGDWIDLLSGLGPGWSRLDQPYPVMGWFWHRAGRDKVGFILEIGPIDPPSMRHQVVTAFEEAGFRVGKRAYRDEAKYTRVFTFYRALKDWEDEEEVDSVLSAIWAKAKPEIAKATQVLERLHHRRAAGGPLGEAAP